MTGDIVFDLSIITFLVSLAGVSGVIFYAVGNHMGVKKVEKELYNNGWVPLERQHGH